MKSQNEPPDMKKILALAFVLLSFSAFAQKEIKIEDAAQHVGDSVTLSGKVFGLRYLADAKNSPTFINLGAAFPNQLLTVVIWGDVRSKLTTPPTEENSKGKLLTITGKIELYRGKPQIVLLDPAQMKMSE